MRGFCILTPLILALGLAAGAPASAQQPASVTSAAPATQPDDSVILDMREAFRRGDKARLAALLPLAAGNVLEPWAAYWALKVRLDDATEPEVQDFLSRWAGTYQEDRLRNDWLLLAGKRRDWAAFAREWPRFRMQDDPELRCYATAMQVLQGTPASAAMAESVRRDWLAERREGDGKAIGGACRHAGRAIEDCYTLNRKADRSAIFAGWREMNDYMAENKLDVVAPTLTPPGAPAPLTAAADDEPETKPDKPKSH